MIIKGNHLFILVDPARYAGKDDLFFTWFKNEFRSRLILAVSSGIITSIIIGYYIYRKDNHPSSGDPEHCTVANKRSHSSDIISMNFIYKAMSDDSPLPFMGGCATIIFILILAFGITVYRFKMKQHRIDSAGYQIGMYNQAIEDYYLDCKEYPSENIGLKALITNPGVSNWKGPYLTTKDPVTFKDPWANPYIYKIIDGKPKIFSAGPDKKPGTDDDIYNIESAYADD